MAFTGAATTVIAQTFILQDPNGVIVAQLGASDASLALNGDSLQMKHNDVLTSDSSLTWTQPASFGAGLEAVWLQGPEVAGGVGIGAFLQLSVGLNAAAPKRIFMSQGNVMDLSVVDPVTNADTVQLHLTDVGHVFNTRADVETVADVANVTRGNRYGFSFHKGTTAGNIVLTTAAQTCNTIAMPIAPVAGAIISLAWSVRFQVTTLGVAVCIADVTVNGVVVPELAILTMAVATDQNVSQVVCNYPAPIGITYNILLRVRKSAAVGVANSDATSSTISATYYR